MVDWPAPRTLGVVLYPGFDLLDVTGPLHAFGMLKNVFEPVLVGPAAGPVASAQGPALVADTGSEQADPLDLLLMPGNPPSLRQDLLVEVRAAVRTVSRTVPTPRAHSI